MQKPFNIAIIGCGRISEKHLVAITSGQLPARLVAVCDIDEEKAKAKAQKYNVPYYLSFNQMMERHKEIDIINVLTPTGYHAKHVIELAQYKKHIIVEKPMALSLADCDAMIENCKKNGCRLFVVKQNRFNRAVVAARTALERGRFGKLVMGTVRVRWCRDQHYYEQADWRGTWELDGGVMSQQASHHIDLLQWFMGDVEFVQCQIATRLMNIEVEDTALAIFKFTSQALGAFEATVCARPKDMEGSLSILGEKGSVVIGGHAVNHISHWNFVKEEPIDADIQKHYSQDVPNVYGHGHGPYLADVMEAIIKDRPALVEGEEGRKNIAILTALYESAANNGAPIKPGSPCIKSRLAQKS